MVVNLKKLNVEFFYGDITDKATLQKAMQGVDTVIHMAAECNSKKTDLMYSANVEGTKRIVEVCKSLSINKLIYLSSVAVVFEDKCSHDKYCSTKKQAEEIVLNSQLNSVILRPSAIYPSKGGFAMPVKLARYFPVIPLPEFTWRRRLQQPVYIENVIEVILKALQSDQAKTNKPYFVAGPNTQTIEELVAKLDHDNHSLATQIAEIPELIRGYGHIKATTMEDAEVKKAQLMGAFRDPVQRPAAAE